MKKKQLFYIIGGIVIALIVLFLVIHLVIGGVRGGGGNGSSGYVNPPARLVQVMASSPGSGIRGLGLQIPNDHFQAPL